MTDHVTGWGDAAGLGEPAGVQVVSGAEKEEGILTDNAERYPEAAAAFASAGSSSGRDNALEFGLARIVDGLAALVATRAG